MPGVGVGTGAKLVAADEEEVAEDGPVPGSWRRWRPGVGEEPGEVVAIAAAVVGAQFWFRFGQRLGRMENLG